MEEQLTEDVGECLDLASLGITRSSFIFNSTAKHNKATFCQSLARVIFHFRKADILSSIVFQQLSCSFLEATATKECQYPQQQPDRRARQCLQEDHPGHPLPLQALLRQTGLLRETEHAGETELSAEHGAAGGQRKQGGHRIRKD